MPLHADQIPLSREAGAALRLGVEIGVITDAIVAAANTVAGLRSAISGAAVHADQKQILQRIDDAIDYLVDSSELTDAGILSLTTTEQLVDLTQAADSARAGLLE